MSDSTPAADDSLVPLSDEKARARHPDQVGPRAVGHGQHPDPAAAHEARPLPRDDLRLGPRRSDPLGVRGRPRHRRRTDPARLRHRHRRRARADAGGERGREARRPGRHAPEVDRHPRRAAVRAGRERVRDRGVRAQDVLHPAAPLRAGVRRVHRHARRHRDGARNADGLATPPGPAPARHAADPGRATSGTGCSTGRRP